MKINNYKPPHSSFLSLDKDLSLIVDKLMQDERLCRLLYYPTKDCINQNNLTYEQKVQLFTKQISIVPKITIDPEIYNYLIVCFDSFLPNDTNPQFRNNTLGFDIISHFSTWVINDSQIRPYRIAAEIDTILSEIKLTGIGELEFYGADFKVINDEFIDLVVLYSAIHGGEDKKFLPNPNDEEKYQKEFNELFNS